MGHDDIDSRLLTLLRSLSREPDLPIEAGTRIRHDLGLTSFDVLELRDGIERAFSVRLADRDVVRLTTPASITDLLAELGGPAAKQAPPAAAPPPPPPTAPAPPAHDPADFGASRLGPQRELRTRIEIGMPLTGLQDLAENPLLKELGDLRWKHVARLTGVPSREVVDDEGDRLYATFFFVDVSFPESRPMASFGENDRFEVVSTLRRFGSSLLDGEHWLYPDDVAPEERIAPLESDEALRERVPCVRLANIFVKQWEGASWLRQSRPAHPAFLSLREVSEAPDVSGETARIKEAGELLPTPEGWVPFGEEALHYEYAIVPDRDLNGAGLLYFANYPLFLDLAERAALEGPAWWQLPSELVDRRTLLRRRSAYFSNATRDDALLIETRGFVKSPLASGEPEPELAPVRLLFHHRMRRRSDDRLMMVSSASKVLNGVPLGQSPLAEALREREAGAQEPR